MSVKREEIVRDELTEAIAKKYGELLEIEEAIEEGKKVIEDYRRTSLELAETFYWFVRTRMRDYAEETNSTGVEFLAFVTTEGFALILEGEEDRVEAPVKEAVAEVHTHPDLCLPSGQDYRTAWHLFSRGLVVFSVYSVQCYFSIALTGPYTEEDYVKLLSLSREVKKVRTVDEYFSVVRKYAFEGLTLSVLPP